MTLFEIAKPAANLEEERSENIEEEAEEEGTNQRTGAESLANQRPGLRENEQSELNAGRFVRYQFTQQVNIIKESKKEGETDFSIDILY